MDNLGSLLILLLVGIFSFAIATLFRSNKALDKVGEVEKEVKAIEEELAHAESGNDIQKTDINGGLPNSEIEEEPLLTEDVQPASPSTETNVASPRDGKLYAGSFPKSDDIHMN